jgi:hypothetical protein
MRTAPRGSTITWIFLQSKAQHWQFINSTHEPTDTASQGPTNLTYSLLQQPASSAERLFPHKGAGRPSSANSRGECLPGACTAFYVAEREQHVVANWWAAGVMSSSTRSGAVPREGSVDEGELERCPCVPGGVLVGCPGVAAPCTTGIEPDEVGNGWNLWDSRSLESYMWTMDGITRSQCHTTLERRRVLSSGCAVPRERVSQPHSLVERRQWIAPFRQSSVAATR